jgi:hypothetical protein
MIHLVLKGGGRSFRDDLGLAGGACKTHGE